MRTTTRCERGASRRSYLDDERLLASLELHDRPYGIWRKLQRTGRVDSRSRSRRCSSAYQTSPLPALRGARRLYRGQAPRPAAVVQE
ncbi:MAG: hypothetical protein WKF40_02500 [Thermoleophilaceae bacterium]